MGIILLLEIIIFVFVEKFVQKIIWLALAFGICLNLQASPAVNDWTVSGKVVDAVTSETLMGAVANLESLWAVTDENGVFVIPKVQQGRYVLKVSLLGYVDAELAIDVKGDIEDLVIAINESSLALEGVTVTAQRPKDGIGTSHNIGRDALNHLQISNMSDMASLLPGGKTVNPDLTAAQAFSIRDGGSSMGNAAFSTAVEVDGVRVGNNAGFGEMSGVDTRSISVDNVESVEVLSGVPSAEYGDLGAGMVKVHTKTGRTPFNVVFSVNPRTYQASVSKGVEFSRDRGVLNLSAEWANATKKLSSPYESYTRRGLTLKYSNTFAEVLRFEAGLSGNLGGMNSEDDPDAFSGEYTKVRDNVLRANTSLKWQVNRPWITSLKFDASVNYNDNLSHAHKYNSYASSQPSVHSESVGYYLAERLPLTYFSDQIVDSRELDFAASAKYDWTRRWGDVKSNLKAGLQWKANGNVGQGEYYEDPSLAANGYRPRPYSDYPFMHNISAYAEEDVTFPFGLHLTAGLRMDNVYVRGSKYTDVHSLSPRFNAKWNLGRKVTVRGGWGVSEKLPSFYILYPKPEYRDIQTFGFSHGSSASYVYYTQPFMTEFNPDMKWQRSSNSELGVDLELGEFKMSLVGFLNITQNPYRMTSHYAPFTYNISAIAPGYQMPDNPQITVDNQTGDVYLRGGSDVVWTPMATKVTDVTFVKTTRQDNAAPMTRAGAEATVDFPEIKPIRTALRFDASYVYTGYEDHSESYYYNNGWSHTNIANRSYQYVGIFANGGGSNQMACGKKTHKLDANLTAITHIPEARLIITCRLEMSLLTRSMNIPAGGTDKLLPVAYLTEDGVRHEFTEADAANPEFTNLILYPGNDYMFLQDGYGAYASANLSITKEIGKHVSLSFFANNFTNARPYVTSMATGVAAIYTPNFYYGLTCRIKL